MNKKGEAADLWIVFIGVLLLAFVVGGVFAAKSAGPWWSETTGKSALREAEWSKRIAVEEAQAELDSAELKKQADVIRARGIAEANEIIAKSLTAEYIQWKWVEGLHDGSSETIYIPTEANMPILEARGE